VQIEQTSPTRPQVQRPSRQFSGLEDDQVITLKEFAALAGVSLMTVRRIIDRKEGPVVTRMSPRRLGIRVRHAREYLDRVSSETTGGANA